MAGGIERVGKCGPAEIGALLAVDRTGVVVAGDKGGDGQGRREEEVIVLHKDAPTLIVFVAGLMGPRKLGSGDLLSGFDYGDETEVELVTDFGEIFEISSGKGRRPDFVD